MIADLKPYPEYKSANKFPGEVRSLATIAACVGYEWHPFMPVRKIREQMGKTA
jgi:hypothetical protein